MYYQFSSNRRKDKTEQESSDIRDITVRRVLTLVSSKFVFTYSCSRRIDGKRSSMKIPGKRKIIDVYEICIFSNLFSARLI